MHRHQCGIRPPLPLRLTRLQRVCQRSLHDRVRSACIYICICTRNSALSMGDLGIGLPFIYVRFPGAPCKHTTSARLFDTAPELRAALIMSSL